jgi:hypothetical protein
MVDRRHSHKGYTRGHVPDKVAWGREHGWQDAKGRPEHAGEEVSKPDRARDGRQIKDVRKIRNSLQIRAPPKAGIPADKDGVPVASITNEKSSVAVARL